MTLYLVIYSEFVNRTMPRKYQCKGLKRKYTTDFKEEVLNSLRTTCGGNVCKAARLHDVPEQTLRDWHNRHDGFMAIGSGGSTDLPNWVESDLVDALCVLSSSALPLTRSDVRDLAQEVTKGLKFKTKFKDDRPGEDWVYNFEKRW